jgi:flagellar basal body rod protein FlgC
MIASASTPGGLMSACLTAIQGYHASTRQAEQAVAAIAQPQRAAPSGMTHLPAVAAPGAPVQDGAVSRVAVQVAQRAYEANVSVSNGTSRMVAA